MTLYINQNQPEGKLGMKKICFVLALAMALFAGSCSSEKGSGNQEEKEQTELPPSIRTQNSEIAFVQLSNKEQNELNIQTVAIQSNLVDYSVMVPGVVFPAPEHSSLISTPIDGQISRIYKFEGNPVRKGEVLFQLQSFEFGNLVSEYLQAFAEENYQRSRLNRLIQLVEETISSESELERARAEYERASAVVRAAYSKLRAIGVSESEINQFTDGENIVPLLNIHSTIEGVVESNFVELGQSVNALENLARLLDMRKVLVRAYISPDDARLISTGDSVYISKREFNSSIGATITTINPGMDENNRSVIANVVIPTKSGWPKPGENLRVQIRTSSKIGMISIPSEALTYDGNNAIVFVKLGNGIYERRPIKISEIRDKHIFVESGLQVGDEIAISHVFSLKALLRFHLISEE